MNKKQRKSKRKEKILKKGQKFLICDPVNIFIEAKTNISETFKKEISNSIGGE